MTQDQFRNFADALDDVARDIVRACRRAVRELNTMSWPTLLGWCVVFAMIISILPLALFLFVLFLGLKVVAGAFILDRRRNDVQKTDLHKE